MKLSESDLQELYQSMTARRTRQTGDCPGEELLIQAASNELGDPQRTDVVAHIARCSDCAREYRIARSLRHLQSEEREGADAGVFARRWWGLAAAAAIALMLPALVWLAMARRDAEQTIARLQQQVATQREEIQAALRRPAPAPPESANLIAEVTRPQVGVPIVDLDAGVVRGGGPAVPVIVVPPTSDIFTLILHLSRVTTDVADVELADGRGAVMWSDRVAPDKQSGTITLALNRRAVPAGAYAIDVRAGGGRTTFPFRVEYR